MPGPPDRGRPQTYGYTGSSSAGLLMDTLPQTVPPHNNEAVSEDGMSEVLHSQLSPSESSALSSAVLGAAHDADGESPFLATVEPPASSSSPSVKPASPSPLPLPPGQRRNETGLSNSRRRCLRSSRRRCGAGPPCSVLRIWVWELLSLLAAVGLVVAVTAVLSVHNGSPLPELPYGMSLNSLVALLATLLRSAVAVVVIEVLGQARWSWFASSSPQQARPLSDLEIYQAAGHGLIGSMELIRVFVGRAARAASPAGFISLAGAFVMVASFAIGTFTQQAVQTVPCRRQVEGQATFPVAFALALKNTGNLAGAPIDVGYELKGAMIAGLTSPKGNNSNIIPICPTGNCTFPFHSPGVTHLSVGLCSQCLDTSEFLEQHYDAKTKIMRYSLPGLRNSSMIHNTSWPILTRFVLGSSQSYAQHRWSNEFAEAAPSSLLNLNIVAFSRPPPVNGGPPPNSIQGFKPVAVSCNLYLCLKYYYAEVKLGQFNETLIRAEGMRKIPAPQEDWTALREPCIFPDGKHYTVENITSAPRSPSLRLDEYTSIVLPGQSPGSPDTIVKAPSSCVSQVWGATAQGLEKEIHSIFVETKQNPGEESLNAVCEGGRGRPYDAIHCNKWWLQSIASQWNANFDSISWAIGNFTNVITTRIRMSGAAEGLYGFANENSSSTTVVGEVWQTKVCTHVNWLWLLMPVGVVAVTAALLVYVVARSSFGGEAAAVPVWKGSVLPLVLYGLLEGRPYVAAAAADPSARSPTTPADGGTDDEARAATTPGANRNGDDDGPLQMQPRREMMNLSGVEDVAKRTMVVFQRTPADGGRPGFSVVDTIPEKTPLNDDCEMGDRISLDSLLEQPYSGQT
ncbi:hypothetical protein MAPG_08699 [Magnaporthiopsis poae ATCC 64411]|uniref:Uncharacterized protein n=1 Tax=Magnaporthiopsis poae (strain ATCC 64411 / 73-15) TaxID=644358 RepID=A0A0C4E813_MAGP6|nr:hypothetical protein MAPG_08699 [Magnaporthiopsis poae ATCC 64411]